MSAPHSWKSPRYLFSFVSQSSCLCRFTHLFVCSVCSLYKFAAPFVLDDLLSCLASSPIKIGHLLLLITIQVSMTGRQIYLSQCGLSDLKCLPSTSFEMFICTSCSSPSFFLDCGILFYISHNKYRTQKQSPLRSVIICYQTYLHTVAYVFINFL